MLSTLEQAINSLHTSKQPITVRNAIAAYLSVGGFSGTDVCVEDAVVAFEHALDKHPLPPMDSSTTYHRQFVLEVDVLRKKYWTEKSGCSHCVCGKCGSTLVPKELMGREEDSLYVEAASTKQSNGGKSESFIHPNGTVPSSPN